MPAQEMISRRDLRYEFQKTCRDWSGRLVIQCHCCWCRIFCTLYYCCAGWLGFSTILGAEMTGACDSSDRVSLRRAGLVAQLTLATTLFLFAPANAGAQVILQVGTTDTLPGFHLSQLPRYLVLHMAEARLADWHFEPAADKGSAPDRVEWSFKLNPYAGGEVHTFVRPHMAERTFAAHRAITIEARLYLNGEYQTLVKQQAVVQGGPGDPDLAAAVAGVTQNLLGPQGAFRAIDSGRGPAQGPR